MEAVRLQMGLLLIVLAVSILVHSLFLTQPRQVVFDEVHFGKFITAYCCTHHRFFDIHPPHGKLLIAGTAWLFGYRGGVPFEHIGQAYNADVPIGALRLFPALTGIFLPLIIYGLLRVLGASIPISFLGAWLVLFDNALTLQTRIIALDGLLLLTTFGSLLAWLAAERLQSHWRWALYALAGAAAGMAVGTKFTGLTALGMLGVFTLVGLWRSKQPLERRQWFGAGLLALAAAAGVYIAGWALHFYLVPLPSLTPEFRVPDFASGPLVSRFFVELFELHKVMLSANYGLGATHPYASQWWTWPIMQRPVFYWQQGTQFIYLLGNPLLWWGALLLFVGAVVSRIQAAGRSRAAWRGRHQLRFWIPLLGYAIALGPFVRIPRPLFLYHYFMPLLFSLLTGLLWIESLRGSRLLPPRQQLLAYIAVMVGAAVLFLWFSPLTYGLPVEPSAYGWLFWFSSWR